MTFFGTTDFLLEVAKGNITGHKIMKGLGERNNIGTTATGEDLWLGNDLSAVPSAPGSTTSIPFPSSAGEQMSIICENAKDTSGGSGVQSVTVHYLDDTGAEQSTLVITNGTTAVNLTPTNVRFVQEIAALTVGSTGVAEGNIRIYKTSDARLVYSMIAAGGNQSLVPHRMVPLGKTLHIVSWTGSEVRAKRVFLRLSADCNDLVIPPVKQTGVFLFKETIGVNASTSPYVPVWRSVPALSVVKVSAFAVSAGGEASCSWAGVLVDD